MRRFLEIAALAALACLQSASAAVTDACKVLAEKDAIVVAGGPLGEIAKNESKPDSTNGNDHTFTCGYFPKGYSFEKADRPPDRGVEVQLHNLPSAGDARKMYDFTLDANQQMAKEAGTRNPDGKPVTMVSGLGDAGFFRVNQIEPEPKNPYRIVILTFCKGNVMAQVTVWKKGSAAPDAAARDVAKQVAAMLP